MAMTAAGEREEGGRHGHGRVSSELHGDRALARPYHATVGRWAAAERQDEEEGTEGKNRVLGAGKTCNASAG